MSNIIEIRDLKKGDTFTVHLVPYIVTETDTFFRAVSFNYSPEREISGPTASKCKFQVRLIKRADETN